MKFTPSIVFAIITLFCFSCGSESDGADANASTNDTLPEVYNNITILLDFSNRVLVDNQNEKDKKIIKLIFDLFESNQKKFLYQGSKEKLRTTIAFQQASDNKMFTIGDKLSIDMAGKNFPKFKKEKAQFLEGLEELYASASKNSMTGADIWTFFRDNKPTFIGQSSKENVVIKNKVIILTDGYLQFSKAISAKRPKGTYMSNYHLNKMRKSSNWKKYFERPDYKLKPHEEKYENLSVLMLEINPKNPAQNINEFEILKRYWTDWFSEMGVDCEVLRTVDLVSEVEGTIKKFIEE